jgi:pyruvate ferredoxin oxidoreductase alpha subunit
LEAVQVAVDSCFFPLFEIERGLTTITYDPEAVGRRVPVAEWLKRLGKTRHLAKPENAEVLESIESEVDRRWRRLKAMHESELL